MQDYSDLGVAAQAVADPMTSAADLAVIAHRHAGLRVQVAGHPRAYAGLLDWLGALGDAEVAKAVMARRERDGATVAPPPPPPGEPDAATAVSVTPVATTAEQAPVPAGAGSVTVAQVPSVSVVPGQPLLAGSSEAEGQPLLGTTWPGWLVAVVPAGLVCVIVLLGTILSALRGW